jgi:hypothetical protein
MEKGIHLDSKILGSVKKITVFQNVFLQERHFSIFMISLCTVSFEMNVVEQMDDHLAICIVMNGSMIAHNKL